MRLTYATQLSAQTKADAIHQWMQTSSAEAAAYALSVKQGRTTAAMVPYQDKDANRKAIGTSWYINVKDRHRGALTKAEIASLT